MNAKKCDRCNDYYEPKEKTPMEQAIEQFTSSLSVPSRVEAKLKAIDFVVDLCPKCKGELAKWMKKGEFHVE